MPRVGVQTLVSVSAKRVTDAANIVSKKKLMSVINISELKSLAIHVCQVQIHLI